MSRFVIGEDGILSSLLHEFPYLYTSPETIHYLWQKHAKQIQSLTKAQKEIDSIVNGENRLGYFTNILKNRTKNL